MKAFFYHIGHTIFFCVFGTFFAPLSLVFSPSSKYRLMEHKIEWVIRLSVLSELNLC